MVTTPDTVNAMIQAGIEAVDLYEIARDDGITKGHLRRFLNAALRAQAAETPDPFNRKQVEAICRAVCAVEGLDPDDTEWTGDDPPWTRYADAVAVALFPDPAQAAPDLRETIAELQYEAGMYRSLYENAVERCAKVAESNGWEATAAQIRALETGERLL